VIAPSQYETTFKLVQTAGEREIEHGPPNPLGGSNGNKIKWLEFNPDKLHSHMVRPVPPAISGEAWELVFTNVLAQDHACLLFVWTWKMIPRPQEPVAVPTEEKP
jgi:hypothetical protein